MCRSAHSPIKRKCAKTVKLTLLEITVTKILDWQNEINIAVEMSAVSCELE